MNTESDKVHSQVQQYYGQTLTSSQCLLTNACTLSKSNLTNTHKKVMGLLNEQITSKFYGCGSSIPLALEGKVIVDLGCGTGVDVYLASYFAKESGKVIGIDMTPAQLKIAERYKQQTAKKFGFERSNVQFMEGRIQKIPLPDNSADVVISNCVINLSPNKKEIFAQIRRILRVGGQLYFSDIYASSRMNQDLKNDKVLWGEGLSGALYIQDFRRIMSQLGFKDCRIMSKSNLNIYCQEIKKKVQGTKFCSITHRCFKLADDQDRPQNYGQTAKYLGGVEESEELFQLDKEHCFKKGQAQPVCGNTASILKNSRFAKFFEVDQRKQHMGLFGHNKISLKQINKNQCQQSGSCC